MIRQSSKVSRQQEVERYLRDASRGLTTVELASRMGVSTRTVQRTLADLDVVNEGNRYKIPAERRSIAAPESMNKHPVSVADIQEWLKDGPISIAEFNRRAQEAGAEAELEEMKRTFTDDWDGLLEHARRTLGSAAAINSWLHSSLMALGGETPMDAISRKEFERLHSILFKIEFTIGA